MTQNKYDPTPEQIQAACERIRAEREFRKCRGPKQDIPLGQRAPKIHKMRTSVSEPVES